MLGVRIRCLSLEVNREDVVSTLNHALRVGYTTAGAKWCVYLRTDSDLCTGFGVSATVCFFLASAR